MQITYTPDNNKARTVSAYAHDVEEFVHYCETAKPENADNSAGAAYWRLDDQAEWMGFGADEMQNTTSVKLTIKYIRDGWPRGLKLYDELSEAMTDTPVPTSIRRRSRWTDQGDDLEMQRVYSGDLDRAWRRTQRAPARGPQRVRIVVDALAHGGVDADVMAWRGVAAVALCDALVAAGYMVEMLSAWNGYGYAGRQGQVDYRLAVVTKAFHAPVDIATLLATNALPAFFRALGHLFQPLAARGPCGGSPAYLVRPLDATEYASDDAYLFVAPQSINSARAAREWVAGCIEDIEIARDPERAGEVVAA